MKTSSKKIKKYACKRCGNVSNVIGVVQTETHYYSLMLDTDQLEDFHGDEEVMTQKFFCLNCNNKINENKIY